LNILQIFVKNNIFLLIFCLKLQEKTSVAKSKKILYNKMKPFYMLIGIISEKEDNSF